MSLISYTNVLKCSRQYPITTEEFRDQRDYFGNYRQGYDLPKNEVNLKIGHGTPCIYTLIPILQKKETNLENTL